MSLLSIWRIPIPPGGFVAVTMPGTARRLALTNNSGQDVNLRSDPTDAQTEDLLPNGQQITILTNDAFPALTRGAILVWAQTTQNQTATLVLKYG